MMYTCNLFTKRVLKKQKNNLETKIQRYFICCIKWATFYRFYHFSVEEQILIWFLYKLINYQIIPALINNINYNSPKYPVLEIQTRFILVQLVL